MSIKLAVGLALALLFLFFRAPEIWRAYKKRERRKKVEADLPFAAHYVASLLEAGLPLEDALEKTVDSNFGELSKILGEAMEKFGKGRSLAKSLESAGKGMEKSSLSDLLAVFCHINRTGSHSRATESLKLLADCFEERAVNGYREFISRSQVLLTVHVALTALLPAVLLFLSGVSSSLGDPLLSRGQLSILFCALFPLTAGAANMMQGLMRPC